MSLYLSRVTVSVTVSVTCHCICHVSLYLSRVTVSVMCHCICHVSQVSEQLAQKEATVVQLSTQLTNSLNTTQGELHEKEHALGHLHSEVEKVYFNFIACSETIAVFKKNMFVLKSLLYLT